MQASRRGALFVCYVYLVAVFGDGKEYLVNKLSKIKGDGGSAFIGDGGGGCVGDGGSCGMSSGFPEWISTDSIITAA